MYLLHGIFVQFVPTTFLGSTNSFITTNKLKLSIYFIVNHGIIMVWEHIKVEIHDLLLSCLLPDERSDSNKVILF